MNSKNVETILKLSKICFNESLKSIHSMYSFLTLHSARPIMIELCSLDSTGISGYICVDIEVEVCAVCESDSC